MSLPISRRRLVLAVVGAVVVAAAGIVYANWIVVQRPDPSQLSRLVVTEPPAGFDASPVHRGPVETSQIAFAKAKSEAERTPANAGVFSSTWKGDAHHKGQTAEVLLMLAPSDADAKAVHAEAAADYLSTKQLSADGYTVNGHFTVPAIPGSSGISFTSTSAKTSVAVVVFRYDRAVVVAFADHKGSAPHDLVVTLAQREVAVLQGALPGFSTVASTFPLVASLAYWGTAAALVIVAAISPPLVRGARRRAARRHEEALRRERLSRGRKVVKRRGPALGKSRSFSRR